jgi:hypothetical protein
MAWEAPWDFGCVTRALYRLMSLAMLVEASKRLIK